jgi:two-component system sensor histidine kinase ComP
MVKQRIIDVNFHLPKLVSYTALFLLAIAFHLFWQSAISSSFVNQDLIILFDFLGILLLILSILILYRVLPPFIAKRVFGHHDQMQKHKNELMSKLIKNEHIDSILDFLLSSINQVVAVKSVCIVIEKEQKKEYIKSTGLFVGQEHIFMNMNRDISEKELESIGIDSTIPLSYQNEVHGFIYLGEKVNGSRLEKEELSKLNDLLEYGSNVVFSAIFIHQLEKEKQHLFDNNQMVQREVSQLQMYNDLLLEAQERERKDLSTYLHDEILQNAIFLNRSLEASIENKDTEHLMFNKDHIKSALEISSQVVLEIREKCFDLYPAMIEDIGFIETCEYFFTNNRIYTGGAVIAWSCEFTDKETQMLSISEQKIVYRCVKELVMNAIKHAKSKTIEIKFEKKNDQFIFSVIDDGKGFTVPSYLSKKWVENKHIGLITVKQNIERIGGHLDISSSKDKGTKLSICMNRPTHANENMEREVANEAYSSVVSR